MCSPTVTEIGVLVNKPLTNLKKATENFDKHFFEKHLHKSAVQAALISKVQQNNILLIDHQLNTLTRANSTEPCKLWSIVETIIFCRRQGITLRGHRDNHAQSPF